MGTRQNPSKHGLTGTRIYEIYRGIKSRCYSKKDYHYKWYGIRGITMCDEWFNDPLSFYNWSIANGYKDNLTIDRIDNNKGYSPDNCRWVDIKTQCNNRTTNHLITINGTTKTLAEWCEYSGIGKNTISRNLKKGYTGEKILTPEKFHMNKSKIAQYSLNGKIIKIWNTLMQIEKELKYNTQSISNCCKHKTNFKTAYGFGWSYYPKDIWKPSKRSDAKVIEFKGESHTYEEWAKIFGISKDHFRHNINKYLK